MYKPKYYNSIQLEIHIYRYIYRCDTLANVEQVCSSCEEIGYKGEDCKLNNLRRGMEKMLHNHRESSGTTIGQL